MQLGVRSVNSLVLAAVVATTALVGCAGDQGLVDRIQPNYVKKSDLLNKTWYYRRTVVDAPENTDMAFTTVGHGDTWLVHRVRFEIQENWLIARRDHPFVDNTDGRLSDEDGQPVVMFPIEQHFDIIRQYNSSTGEQTNVKEENSQDRQWHERDYMRVEWNATFLSEDDFSWTVPLDWMDTNTVPGGDFYIHPDDFTNPYHARLTPGEGYLDFVSNHFVQPSPWFCYGTLGMNIFDAWSCGAGEVKVRHAFMDAADAKLDGYKKLNYPDTVALKQTDPQSGELVEIRDPETDEVVREPIFDRFGFFRSERLSYDEQRNITEAGRRWWIKRFPLWQRELDANGNEIPAAQRVVRPIVYHLNWDFPQELKAAAHEVERQYNDAFKEVVGILQGQDISNLENMTCSQVERSGSVTTGPCRPFRVVDNSCSISNLTNNNGTGYLDRHPKVRKRVYEALGSNIEFERLPNYCSATEYHSRMLGESPRFTWVQNGDPRHSMMYWVNNVTRAYWGGYGPSFSDPLSGATVSAAAYLMGWAIDRGARMALDYVDFINEELSLTDVIRGATTPSVMQNAEFDPKAMVFDGMSVQQRAMGHIDAARLNELETRFAGMGSSMGDFMHPIENPSYFQEKFNAVRGTAVEREGLIRDEDLMVATRGLWKPGMPVDDDMLNEASHITRRYNELERIFGLERQLQERTMCPIAASLDNSLVGLAKELAPIADRDERYQMIREYLFKAVMLHEVGHNVGLMHNFEGSYDALNYHDEFWDIEESQAFSEQDKLEAKQPEFKYSSIMDYHGHINSDFQGLGKYDRAALKFGYGQILETFNNADNPGGTELREFRHYNDYRKLPNYVGSVEKMRDRGHVVFDWNRTDVTFSEIEVLHQTEVPYLYCPDQFAQRTATCRRFDTGANMREIQESNYVRYKNYFLFSNYLRNQIRFNFNALYRSFRPFLDNLLTYQWMYLYRAQDPNFLSTDLGADMATAVERGLNLMSEVVATPNTGFYYRCSVDSGPHAGEEIYTRSLIFDPLVDVNVGIPVDFEGTCDMNDQIYIGIDQGKPNFVGFTEERWDWEFSFFGTYYDKLLSLDLMTWSYAWYPRTNLMQDLRLQSVSFFNLYAPEMVELFGNVINENELDVTSYYDEGSGRVVTRPINNSALAGASNHIPLASSLPINLSRFALLFGHVYLSSVWDPRLDFSTHTRMEWEGGANDFEPALWSQAVTDNRAAECLDRDTGSKIRAIKTNSVVDSTMPIGYDFVSQCAQSAARLDAAIADYNAKKALLESTPTTDPNWVSFARDADKAELEKDIAEFDYQEKRAKIEWAKNLSDILFYYF